MSSASLKFSGNLIEELSQKIPSSLFALNELIKNAYDAFSPDVVIEISPSKKTITITDHGNGMGTEDIESLFHISKSTKHYGHEVEQDGVRRLTQGSKGLGFLSAFKFGDKVEWVTCKAGVRSEFSIRKSELVAKEDIAGTVIPVVKNSHSESGTIITVYSSSGELEELLSDLSDSRVVEKLAATILDENFDIQVHIENQQQIVSTKKLSSFQEENEERQLFYVIYDSLKNEIEFYHKGEHVKSFSFELERADYLVSFELIIFYFSPGKNSKSVSPLNRRTYDDALYPLVYINRNLFNNTVIFDPEVLRKKSSGETLPQMIGRVSVTCQSKDIEFNSDRTNFVENSLTRALLKDLEGLNKLVQTKGAELKKGLRYGKKVPTGKAMPVEGVSEQRNGVALILIDRKKPTTFYTPSEQINLEEYIFQVRNSLGEDVKNTEVEITVDGEKSSSKILSSVEEPCEKKVCFRYQDAITSLVSKEITLSFEIKISNISGKVQDKSLFTIQSDSNYSVRIETVSDLINAIDKAYSSRAKEEFLPVIACSIRSIFEISSAKILKVRKQWFSKFDEGKLNSVAKREIKDKLLLNVVHVVLLLKKNPKLVTEISDVSGVSYSTLNNLLDINDFKSAVKNSHIGAHQSTRYLSKPKVESCADACGHFSVICDVLLNSDKVRSFNINKVDESDIDRYLGS